MPGKLKRRTVTWQDVGRLAELQVTTREAAGYFGIKESKFLEMLRGDVRVAKAWEQGQQNGKISLRRRQIRMSESNPQMAIFLGKQWLGQDEVHRLEHSGPQGGPIVSSIDLKQLGQDERQDLRKLLDRARAKQS